MSNYKRSVYPRGRPEKPAYLPDGTPNLTNLQWAGAAAEHDALRGFERARPANDRWRLNASHVAWSVGVSARAVQKWRRDIVYREVTELFGKWAGYEELQILGRVENGWYRYDASKAERTADIAADARRLYAVAAGRRAENKAKLAYRGHARTSSGGR